MDQILNFLPIFLQKGSGSPKLSEFIEVCKVHQCLTSQLKKNFSESRVQSYVSTVNSKLNTADSRAEGVLLLDPLVDQCTAEVFTGNCVTWTQQLLKMLQRHDDLQEKRSACSVLRKLVIYSAQIPETQRQFNSFISQIITFLCDESVKLEAALLESSLSCLHSCMEHYSGPCGPSKVVIERHLLALVDFGDTSYCPSTAEWGKCFSLLPRIGGGGPQGSQHKANWSALFNQCIGSLHQCIDILYGDIQQAQTFDKPEVSLPLTQLTSSNPLVLQQLHRNRFVRLVSGLGKLLTEPFPVAKSFSVDQILDVISRVLTVNSASLLRRETPTLEQLHLSAVLPTLHGASLDLLVSLIGTARGQLILRATSVMNFFVQVLQGSFTAFDARCSVGERPYGLLRCKAYDGLQQWLIASRAACGASKYGETLITQALSDLIVHRDTVKLHQENAADTSAPKKKQKRNVNSTAMAIYSKVDASANQEVCRAALKFLSALLVHCGSWIKPALHKEMQVTVLGVLLELRKYADPSTFLPYNNASCRAELYNLLKMLVLCPSPRWPAPVHYAVDLFTKGSYDPDFEVSNVCTEALVSIRPILRPRAPTLSFPLNPSTVTQIMKDSLKDKEIEWDQHEDIPAPTVIAAAAEMPSPPVPVQQQPVEATRETTESTRADEEPLRDSVPLVVAAVTEEEVPRVAEADVVDTSHNKAQEAPAAVIQRKRIVKISESPKPKKILVEEVTNATSNEELDLMIASFVDAPSDSL